jgi:hypothetical protein
MEGDIMASKKPPKLGCVNATFPAKVVGIVNDEMVTMGYCADTPNAAAYTFSKYPNAFLIRNSFVKYMRSLDEEYKSGGHTFLAKSRVDMAGGFNNDKQAGFVTVDEFKRMRNETNN